MYNNKNLYNLKKKRIRYLKFLFHKLIVYINKENHLEDIKDKKCKSHQINNNNNNNKRFNKSINKKMIKNQYNNNKSFKCKSNNKKTINNQYNNFSKKQTQLTQSNNSFKK